MDKINPVKRSNPCNTSGSQKCIGAKPILKARASMMAVLVIGFGILLMSHCPVIQAFVVLVNRIIAAAAA